MANDSFRNATATALADLAAREASERAASTGSAAEAAKVKALEERLGEWLPPGSNTTLPARRSGK